VSLATYRKYEEGHRQRGNGFAEFAFKFDVSLDWIMRGEAAKVGAHLAKRAPGKVAILPARGPHARRPPAPGLIAAGIPVL
jgi:hypothetical protein